MDHGHRNKAECHFSILQKYRGPIDGCEVEHGIVIGKRALSQFFVVEPGDIIVTGTPPGVGLGFKPEPKFLKVGDVVTLGISGLDEQTQKIKPFSGLRGL